MLKPGTPAPDFTATLDDGTPFSLAEQRCKKHVVLYFYPKDFTPGCTAQACSFRDNYGAIAAYDAIIIGVSGDSTDSHQSFRERHQLPFPLIPDPDGRLRALYDAKGWIPWMQPRVTYVIDKDGIIRAALRHDLRVTAHVPEVLEALQQITGQQPAKA
ncbi:peroxiredoxin [Tepidiforma sp.]|uniref:peroxiredoxin n=1 Tax=Tepidiforma sp. TaxID=2682230 RepID=UPI002ADD6AAF|nr:peroxiredoxin [Tepidiforma sp.]